MEKSTKIKRKFGNGSKSVVMSKERGYDWNKMVMPYTTSLVGNINEEEVMDDFFDKLRTQLKNMTSDEKDDWILAQSKILPEWRREDFYKSICGSKKVIDIPERSEIDEFCEKVRNGEIAVEYETHYVEFDDFGSFHDEVGS